MGWYRSWGKRAFDLALGIPIAILSIPFFCVVWVLVRVFLGSPALFRQERPGRDGRIFRMVKFRTMTDARDAEGTCSPMLSD